MQVLRVDAAHSPAMFEDVALPKGKHQSGRAFGRQLQLARISLRPVQKRDQRSCGSRGEDPERGRHSASRN